MALTETIYEIGVTTMGNLLSNLGWFILFVWGIKSIGKEVREGVKQIPTWIETYHKKQMERIRVESALERRT